MISEWAILRKFLNNQKLRKFGGPWGSLVILSAWGAGDPSSNLGGPTFEFSERVLKSGNDGFHEV